MKTLGKDTQMTSEIEAVFKTNLPDDFKVPEVEIRISTASTSKDLT